MSFGFPMISPFDGVLHVDKSTGPTSHDIVKAIRRLTGIRRIGHSGTLDPMASGLLILCLGRATRLVEYLVGLDKVYLAVIRLGQETDTYDSEGQVIKVAEISVSIDDIEQALEQFRGDINQIPPMYSAIKIDGQPLYKLARSGMTVERPSRPVSIYENKILAWETPFLTLQITCSSGTYIRSIAHDLGQTLGCGAYLSSLRRLKIGNHHVKDAIHLEQLENEGVERHLKPTDTAVSNLFKVQLTAEEALNVSLGQRTPIREGFNSEDATMARAYDQEGRFVGVLESVAGHWQPRKIFYQPNR